MASVFRAYRLNTVSFTIQDEVNRKAVCYTGNPQLLRTISQHLGPLTMAVDLQGLARVLEASLDPTQNKQGMIHTSHKVSYKLSKVNSGACYLTRGEEAELFVIIAPDSSYRDIW